MPLPDARLAQRVTRGLVFANTLVLALLATALFLHPAWVLLRAMRDPALETNAIPRVARSLHASLTPGFGRWARQRVGSGRAAMLGTHQITATEWPVFSCVFYLWATEALEADGKARNRPVGEAPSQYARETIEAAATLLVDPNHAHWVKLHWGDKYLESENLFYRMLLIAGLTSYQRLTGDRQHEPMLRQQATSLAAELDASPHGLVDDYPRQCYPIDVIAAVGAIRRAGEVLGIDFSAFVERSKRGFLPPERLDPRYGLPTYLASAPTGRGYDSTRGVGLSFMLVWAAELWPEVAANWYARYEKHFWTEGALVSGFREWAPDAGQSEWQAEVDAGPVIAGFGTAASGFGLAAARANGRADHAYPLALEALAAGWPVADGPLLGARTVSGLIDAPYIGESVILFGLTRTPVSGQNAPLPTGGLRTPPIVFLAMAIYGAFGLALLFEARRRWQSWIAVNFSPPPSWRGQAVTWVLVTLSGLALISTASALVGGALLLIGQLLPRRA